MDANTAPQGVTIPREFTLKPGIINAPEPKPSTRSNWTDREMNEPLPSGEEAREPVNQIFH